MIRLSRIEDLHDVLREFADSVLNGKLVEDVLAQRAQFPIPWHSCLLVRQIIQVT